MAELETPASLVPEVPTIARARANRVDLFDRLWRLLTSVRFAMLLIAIAASGVLAGTLIMQAPSVAILDPISYQSWRITQPAVKYGPAWDTVLHYLDLYRIFSSLWFRAVLAVLSLSVVICTVNRMPGIMASIRRPAVKVPARLFERAPLRAEFAYQGISTEQVQIQVAKVLGARRWRTVPWTDGAALSIFADRNRLGKAGTFLNHLGIITILGAAVIGNLFGWREDNFMVPEGSARQVGHDTGISIVSEDFTDEYYPSGAPRDYRSDLRILENGKEVARKVIRVNDPLEYKGVRVHQAFFGPAAVMRVTDAQGQVAYDDGVALGSQFTGGGLPRNGGSFILGNRQLAVFVLVPAAQRGPDPEIPAGSVRLEIFEPRQPRPTVIETLPQGTPKQIMGYTFEFIRERQFTGLQIARDPAVNLIFAAAACMVIGIMTVFYFPLRRIWARAEPHGDGVRLRFAAVSNRDVLFAREFEQLALTVDEQVDGVARSAQARAPAERPAQPELAQRSVTPAWGERTDG